ncbi:MAG TPA: hypothetical protein VGT41_06605 [Candidatus Babeliales bacterium]|nr:hypothetical protein [Candidatus Babeliales bacterium]
MIRILFVIACAASFVPATHAENVIHGKDIDTILLTRRPDGKTYYARLLDGAVDGTGWVKASYNYLKPAHQRVECWLITEDDRGVSSKEQLDPAQFHILRKLYYML